MYKERFGFAVQHYAVSHLLLIGLFWLIRLFEFSCLVVLSSFSENGLSALSAGLAMDVWVCFVLALFVFPVYLFLYLVIGSVTRFFLLLIFVFYLTVYLGLVSYFVATLSPLNMDVLAHSKEAIDATMQYFVGLSMFSFMPLVVILGLLVYGYPKVQEIMLPSWTLIVFYTMTAILGMVYFFKPPFVQWFPNEKLYFLSVNKMDYFAEKTIVGIDRIEQKETRITADSNKQLLPVVPSDSIFIADELQLLHNLGADKMDPDQLLRAAQKQAWTNHTENARLLCEWALISSPHYTDIRLLLGRTYLWRDDYRTARKHFEECVRREPDNLESWKILVETEIRAQHYQQAIKLSNEAYRLFKNPGFLGLRKKAVGLKMTSDRIDKIAL
jgi:hypothetical protein